MSDPDDERPPATDQRRRQRLVWAVLGALALVAVPVTAYVAHTGRTLGSVEVRTSAPDCEGTDLRRDGAIKARAGMRCLVGVAITNEGGRDIGVGPATLPFLGPRGGGVIRAGAIEGYPALEGDDAIDEVLVIDETLGAGETLQLRIPVLFRQGGCNGPGGTVTFFGFPAVETSYLGRERTVTSDDDLLITQVGPSRGCDKHD